MILKNPIKKGRKEITASVKNILEAISHKTKLTGIDPKAHAE